MLKQAVQQFIGSQVLFTREDRLLLAISGGVDSVVLLHVLHALGYQLALAHCNFKLRGEQSDGDEDFVRTLAERFDVPCHIVSFETKEIARERRQSTQVVARDLRYAFFSTIRTQYAYDYVLTAHHLDDRIETFWLNFNRGTGWKGLASMRAKTGTIRRPFLGVNRQQIDAYRQKEDIAFREDESNASDAYRRNAFRHHVLPALYEWNPEVHHRAADNFTRLEQMLYLYEEQVEVLRNTYIRQEGDSTYIRRSELQEHPAGMTLIWEFLSPLGFNTEQCRQALEAQKGTLIQADGLLLLVLNEELKLHRVEPLLDEGIEWREAMRSLHLGTYGQLTQEEVAYPEEWPANQYLALVDSKHLVYPLKVRHWEPGDVFCPLGMKGKQQKLQDFFVNNKIDRIERNRQLLLVNGNSEVVWVIGHRLDDRYKLTKSSKSVCQFLFKKEG